MPRAQDPVSDSLERLFARFRGLLRGAGRRYGLSQSDVDELEQEVRIRLWRALERGEKIEAVAASYVYRTAVSAALDLIRRRRARPAEPLVEPRDSGDRVAVPRVSGPDHQLEREELAERIAQAVEELSNPRRVAVRLYLAGYGREEIAELLDWTEPKTRNLLYRGLADLRERLAQRGIEPGSVE